MKHAVVHGLRLGGVGGEVRVIEMRGIVISEHDHQRSFGRLQIGRDLDLLKCRSGRDGELIRTPRTGQGLPAHQQSQNRRGIARVIDFPVRRVAGTVQV